MKRETRKGLPSDDRVGAFTASEGPDESERRGGHSRPTKRLSWNDVFSNADPSAPLTPGRFPPEGLALDADAERIIGHQAEHRASPARSPMNATPVSAGPFEIPEDTASTTRQARQGMGSTIALVVFGMLWLSSHWLLPGTVSGSAEVSREKEGNAANSAVFNPRTHYLRFDVEHPRNRHVRWLGQVGHNLIARVDAEWIEQPAEDRIRSMKRLYASGLSPNRLIVLGPDSRRFGEIMDNAYRIYER